MMGCQDPECQKQMREMYYEMYGHKGDNGQKSKVAALLEEMPKKLSINAVWLVLAFIVFPATLALAGTTWAVHSNTQEAIAEQNRRIIVLEETSKNINQQLKSLDEIKKTNQSILKALNRLNSCDL